MNIKQILSNIPDEEHKAKTSFWASEGETCRRAISWRWFGEEPSNPIEVEAKLKMGVGKMVELQLVEQLKKAGLVVDDQRRIEIEREGVKITGYVDAVIKDGGKEIPLEIKSFYGHYYSKELKLSLPKSGYVIQLATYMDALDVHKGYLIHIDRGTGDIYQHLVAYVGNGEYACGQVRIHLNNIYHTYKGAYAFIKDGKLCAPTYQYKYPIDKVKHLYSRGEVSKSKIDKAKRGQSVIGDWQCKYCDWKDKCLKMQGIDLGYSSPEKSELSFIK